jgi:hypothetical protein
MRSRIRPRQLKLGRTLLDTFSPNPKAEPVTVPLFGGIQYKWPDKGRVRINTED